jgi:uroporphyrin-III C-methyltransferase
LPTICRKAACPATCPWPSSSTPAWQQRHAITTLGQLPATLHDEQLGSPSVLVIGDVVRGVSQWALQNSAGAHAAAALQAVAG